MMEIMGSFGSCLGRYLKFVGYEVNYMRNFTDVDDKDVKINFWEWILQWVQSCDEGKIWSFRETRRHFETRIQWPALKEHGEIGREGAFANAKSQNKNGYNPALIKKESFTRMRSSLRSSRSHRSMRIIIRRKPQ